METVIKYILTNFTLSFSCLGLFFFGADLLINPSQQWTESFLFWFLLIPLGAAFFYAGVFHIFFQDIAAGVIGWKPNPFETEIGIANLSYSVISILAAFTGFEVRLVVLAGISVFLWGAAIGHIKDMLVNHNFNPGNAGTIFWTDVLFPIIGLILLYSTNS